MFSTGNIETRRQILSVIGSNLVLINKSLRTDVKKPFLLMEKGKESSGPKNRRFEPRVQPSRPLLSGHAIAAKSIWLRIVHAVRTHYQEHERDFLPDWRTSEVIEHAA